MRRAPAWPLWRAALLFVPAACLIGLAWLLTFDTLDRQHSALPAAERSVVAGGPGPRVREQVAALDRRLQLMVQSWQQDPQHFTLESWHKVLTADTPAPPELMLISRQGVVIQSTMPDAVGLDVSGEAYFREARDQAGRKDNAPVTSVRVDNGLRDWHIRVARWLPAPDRGFDGAIVADDRLTGLQALFRQPAAVSPTTAPLLPWDAALQVDAAAISALILLLAGLLFAWGQTARRREREFAGERILLGNVNTELAAARARADAKAAQLEATLTGISDGVAVLDADLRLVEWNQRFAELAGVPGRLLAAGTPMEDIVRAQAEAGEFGRVQVPTEVSRRMAVMRGLHGEQTAERTRPDGRIIELRRNALPSGGFVTLYRDVTERRHAEDAMREARAMAEAATAAKSRFVAIVSHEIRSPLNALLNTLQLLGGGSLPPSQRALLRMASQSGEALLGLINDVLDMSSMEAGQLSLRPSAFILRPLLESVIEMFHAQAAERGIALRLAADRDLPREAYADPGRLRQVLINLLSNAVKFGIPGPVMLLARRDHDEQDRETLFLAVRDRGPVIEEEGRARLFRPLSPLDITGGETLGSGLGLAICRYLVTLMGGEIGCRTWVADDRHAGNEFWVRLPLAPVPSGARPRPATAEAPARLVLPRTRILLVEDIPANQFVTALLLRREGHLVDLADTAEAALRAAARAPYDLVFTDIHLPGMSGLELARRLLALPGAAGATPVIALTANTGPDDRLECQRAGIRDLLDKPVALADLLGAIARHAWRGHPVRAAALQAAAPPMVPPLLADQRVSELRAHLPPDALRDMVQECLIDLQRRLPVLRRALQDGASAEAVNQAHAMVGLAAGYGMAALERRLRAVMAAARGPHVQAAVGLLDQLETELAQSAHALRDALRIELV